MFSISESVNRLLLELKKTVVSPWSRKVSITDLKRMVAREDKAFGNRPFPWPDFSPISKLRKIIEKTYFGRMVKEEFSGGSPELSEQGMWTFEVPYDDAQYVSVKVNAFRDSNNTYTVMVVPDIRTRR